MKLRGAPWAPLDKLATLSILVALISMMGAWVGCEQEEGARCETTSDCGSGLECCGADTKYENTCRKKCNPCGDGVLDPGEMCDDGNNISGDGCRDDCSSDETCGNGVVDNHSRMAVREECDPPESEQLCNDLGFKAGVATCTSSCQLDLSACEVGCGNGVLEEGVEPEEECDGFDLGGLTCIDMGFSGGELTCAAGCTLDLAGCQGGCGNGTVEPGENCDGEDLQGLVCEDLGFSGGTLACNKDCTWATEACEGLVYGEISVDATTLEATVEGDTTGMPDSFMASCQPNGGTESLYRLLVTQTGYYLITTVPSGDASALNDTILTLITSPDNPATTQEVACNDNDGVGRHAAIMPSLIPGITNTFLTVEGYGNTTGPFHLNVKKVVSPSGTCAAPQTLTGPGVYGARIEWLRDTDAQTGTCIGAGSPEAVFAYTTQNAGSVRVFAESIGDRPFGLYVRTEECDATGVEEGCVVGDYAGAEQIINGLSSGQQIYIIIEANLEDAAVPVVLYIEENP